MVLRKLLVEFCTAVGVQQGTLMSLSSSKLIGTATASSKKLHLGILGTSTAFGSAEQ